MDELDFLSISNLNFAGHTGSKNQFPNRQKIKLDFSKIECRSTGGKCCKFTNVDFFHFRVKMKHFPIASLIFSLSVTLIGAEYVKIGNLENLSPSWISGKVYMLDENTIVIKDFKINNGLIEQTTGYFLAGISDTPPERIDFNQRKFKNTWHDTWTDIDDEMESTLFHYSFDGISFQYNDISPPLIPGTTGFYRRELM